MPKKTSSALVPASDSNTASETLDDCTITSPSADYLPGPPVLTPDRRPDATDEALPLPAPADESIHIGGWPRTSARDAVVLCRVELQTEERTVSLLRILSCGAETVVRTPVWSRIYSSPTDAEDAFAALNSKSRDLLHWSVGAAACGPAWLDATIAGLVEEFVEERDEERERVAREAEKERARAEEERTAETSIGTYFRGKKGRYLLELERGSIKAKRIWSIAFEEAWERDRFWDWFGWQTDRFEEFAEFMREGCRLELERRLLREMLVTEQAVKKQRLGSGGRRPLRFWRGGL